MDEAEVLVISINLFQSKNLFPVIQPNQQAKATTSSFLYTETEYCNRKINNCVRTHQTSFWLGILPIKPLLTMGNGN